MNKETWSKKMQESPADTSLSCARADDLVAYLYGEATQAEAKDFEAHAQHCDSCRMELAAFGQVRGSIREWRQLIFSSPALADPSVTLSHIDGAPPSRQRSALAAIREFFALSPMWMRAATVAASVCGVGVDVLSPQAQQGAAKCDAKTTNDALNQVVQTQLNQQKAH